MLQSGRPHGVRIAPGGGWLVRELDTAFDSASRRRGLLEHERLHPERGLVIAPCQAVHTFGMRMALDVVAVSRGGRVLQVRPHVGPRRIVLAWSAFAVIELAAGTCQRVGLKRGDRLSVVAG